MKSNLRIGDLVCYNAAGQKRNTLALVLDLREVEGWLGYDKPGKQVLLQWCCVGNGMLPRKALNNYGPNKEILKAGSLCWHEVGDWFEVVND